MVTVGEFAKEHGIEMVLRRRWYEKVLPFLFCKRQQEHEQSIKILQSKYEELLSKIKVVEGYYTTYVVPLIAPHTSERLRIKMPNIDFSNIENAFKQIDKEIRYYEQGASKPNVWSEIFEQKTMIIETAKKIFVYKAIYGMPEDKSAVIIRTKYKPKEEEQRKFQKDIEELVKKLSSDVVCVKEVHSIRWIAFCPKKQTKEQIRRIIEDWCGEPAEASVSYM